MKLEQHECDERCNQTLYTGRWLRCRRCRCTNCAASVDRHNQSLLGYFTSCRKNTWRIAPFSSLGLGDAAPASIGTGCLNHICFSNPRMATQFDHPRDLVSFSLGTTNASLFAGGVAMSSISTIEDANSRARASDNLI